jgi:hypothetical protein
MMVTHLVYGLNVLLKMVLNIKVGITLQMNGKLSKINMGSKPMTKDTISINLN